MHDKEVSYQAIWCRQSKNYKGINVWIGAMADSKQTSIMANTWLHRYNMGKLRSGGWEMILLRLHTVSTSTGTTLVATWLMITTTTARVCSHLRRIFALATGILGNWALFLR